MWRSLSSHWWNLKHCMSLVISAWWWPLIACHCVSNRGTSNNAEISYYDTYDMHRNTYCVFANHLPEPSLDLINGRDMWTKTNAEILFRISDFFPVALKSVEWFRNSYMFEKSLCLCDLHSRFPLFMERCFLSSFFLLYLLFSYSVKYIVIPFIDISILLSYCSRQMCYSMGKKME